MKLFGASHLAAIVATLVVAVSLPLAARFRPGRWTRVVAIALAVILVANEVGWWAAVALRGEWGWDYALPFSLCDAAGFVAAAALLTRRRGLVEVAYFWGLAGTVQAIITPDLGHDFPNYFYFQYFVQHTGIVVAAIFLTVGLRLTPRRGAVLRMVVISLGFTALAALADVITHGNYMYLARKPPGGSLLDYMGPWPLYILAGVPVAAASFLLLNLPFRRVSE
ncbi:MAG: TIGR02206 family membrane protein [Candidatus Dormibacteria bacterium]